MTARNKPRYVAILRLAELECDLNLEFEGYRFAIDDGRFEAVLASGIDGFGVKGKGGVVIFLVFVGIGDGLDDLGGTDGAVRFDYDADERNTTGRTLACLFGCLREALMGALGDEDAVAEVVDAVGVGLGVGGLGG
jgi:hypothetical protein